MLEAYFLKFLSQEGHTLCLRNLEEALSIDDHFCLGNFEEAFNLDDNILSLNTLCDGKYQVLQIKSCPTVLNSP